MTALAMIIGMIPMSLGLGEGGEQNAPLGRAVIGGLLLATVATLFFVPVVFRLVHGRREPRRGRAAAKGPHEPRPPELPARGAWVFSVAGVAALLVAGPRHRRPRARPREAA